MDSSVTIGFQGPVGLAKAASTRRVEVSICPHDNAELDESLIARVQVYDHDAMSQLFCRYARIVRSVGQRILRDDGEADDLVQEVFLYIHRRSGLFDSI